MRKWYLVLGGGAIVATALFFGFQLLCSRTVVWPSQADPAPSMRAPKLVLREP